METAIVIIACLGCFWTGYFIRDIKPSETKDIELKVKKAQPEAIKETEGKPKPENIEQWNNLLGYSGRKSNKRVKNNENDTD